MRKRSDEAGDGGLQPPDKTPVEYKASPVLATVEDLDHAVARVRVLKTDAAASMWALGAVIADIKAKQLWKLRNEADRDIPAWKTWDAFAHHELYMTPKNANALAEIAERFTEKQVRAFGTTKLGLILQAPPRAQAELEVKVAEGATKREIETEVRKLRDETGFRRSPGGRPRKLAPAAQSPSRPPPPSASQSLLVPLVPGRVYSSQLFQKPRGRELDWAHRKDLRPVNAPTKLNNSRALLDVGFGDNFIEVAIAQKGEAWEIELLVYREADTEES